VISMTADGDLSVVHSSGNWINLADDGITIASASGEAMINVNGNAVTIRNAGNFIVEGNVGLGGDGAAAILTVANLATWASAIETAAAAGMPIVTPFASLVAGIQAAAKANAK
jgi:hypothetical protein